MRQIRPFVADDIPQVADLYHRTFLKHDHSLARPSSVQEVSDVFAEIFFHNPWCEVDIDGIGNGDDEELPSLVCESADGGILGFLGVTPRRMFFKGRSILAAVSVHFMVEPNPQAGLAGVQILKTFFNGPQEFSLTDGANNPGRKIWEGLGGSIARLQSIYWTRLLRPSALALSLIGDKYRGLRPFVNALSPIGWGADQALARLAPRRFRVAAPKSSAMGGASLDAETLLRTLTQIAAKASFKPDYDERAVSWLLSRAARVKLPGELQQVAVRGAGHKVIGWYLYYLNPGGVSDALQVAAQRDSIGEVFDHLFHHAWERGSIAVTGRVEPNQMDVLADKKCNFSFAEPWVLVHSRDPELLKAVYEGDAFLTRLEGEWCTSFRV